MSEEDNNRLMQALRQISEEDTQPPELSWRERLGGWVAGARILKTDTVLPEYVMSPEGQARAPPIDYVKLMEKYDNSWVMRQISRAIKGEVLSQGLPKIQARFKVKCRKCEREYQTSVKECECGGKRFDKPDEEQRKILAKLLKSPNPQYGFEELLRSTLDYLIALDDFYFYIGNKQLIDRESDRILRKPTDIYIEDSRYIQPVADEKGRLGNDEWFCPKCYDKSERDIFEKVSGWSKRRQRNPKCPQCRTHLIQTCYIQKVGGEIKGRFGKHEIIHGSMSRRLPKLFGRPKMQSVWILINVLMVMDEYNYEVYSEGKVGAILGFPEHDQAEITKMKKKIEGEILRLAKTQIQTGRAIKSRRIRTIFLGIKKEPIKIPLMEDLKKMQSLDFYKLYAKQVCGVFGVTPEFVALKDGKRGTTRMEIDVQNRVTKGYQNTFLNIWNNVVCLKFEITDWILAFPSIEQKDLLREAQILHTKGATALTFLTAGFKVEIDDNQELKVSGKGTPFPKMKIRAGGDKPSRAGQVEDWRHGAAMGVRGTKPETEGEISPRTDALVREAKTETGVPEVRFPVSWYETTKINILGQELAINNDQDEIFLETNGIEVPGTRTDARNFNLAFSKLIDVITQLIHEVYKNSPGFDALTHESVRNHWVQDLEREYDPQILINMANYYQNKNLEIIAREIDNLRARTEKIKLGSEVIQPV